jgi:uncharacterized membrane protein YbhN (UPF0104 family)
MQSPAQFESDLGVKPRFDTLRFSWKHIIALLFGIALLAFLIQRIGFQSVFSAVLPIGWAFFAVVGLNLTRHFLRALSLYRAVAAEHRGFKFRSALGARLGGDALNLISFIGPFLADATKALLLRKNLSLTGAASAVIIDNILYYLTVILFIASGVFILAIRFGAGDDPTMNGVLAAISAGAVLSLTGIIAMMTSGISPISRFFDFLEKRERLPNALQKESHAIRRVEANVFRFYRDRRRDFFTLISISLLTHLVSVTEVYLVLSLLEQNVSVSTALIIESLTKVINATFGFIPGALGAYEGGQSIILRILGYSAAVGLALALVRRGAILVSTSVGLAVLIWRSIARGAEAAHVNPD